MTGSRARRFTVAAHLAAVVLFAAVPARAQLSTGNATQYSIQVTEVALCTDSTSATNTVIGSATKTFDIASADVGAELGQRLQVQVQGPGADGPTPRPAIGRAHG